MKQQMNEVVRLQELAGIPQEGSMSVAQAFQKAGVDLEASCVTVDDEIDVKKFKTGAAALTRLTNRTKGATVSFRFPEDITDPDELMGKPYRSTLATNSRDCKLIVDIMDSGFVEVWQ